MAREVFTDEDKRLARTYLVTLEKTNWEGRSPYMYLDSLGYLTIGIGCLISELWGEGGEVDRCIQEVERRVKLEQIKQHSELRELAENLVDIRKLSGLVSQTEELLIREKITFVGHPTPKLIRAALEELIRLSVIVKAFHRIAKREQKKWASYAPPASFYLGGANQLMISEQLIEHLALERIYRSIADLKRHFPPDKKLTFSSGLFTKLTDQQMDGISKGSGIEFYDTVGFEGYPFPAKEALLELVFNMGITKLTDGFKNLVLLVHTGKWYRIVELREYHRKDEQFIGFRPGQCTDDVNKVDVMTHRNAYVCDRFKEAAKVGEISNNSSLVV